MKEARTNDDALQELIRFARAWDEAMVKNDADEISQFMTDDWVIVGTEGGITPKESFLGWIKSGDLIHSRMDSEDARIRIYGNTGVVTSKGTSGGKYKGEPFSFYEWSTSICTWENGKWHCVLTMLTPAKNN